MPYGLSPISVLLAAALVSAAPRPVDVILSLPYAAKASVPFLLLPEAIQDADDVLLVDLILFGAMTVPNSFTLYHAWSGNARQTALWRKITFVMDASMAVGMAGFAMHGLATLDKDGADAYEGLGLSILLLASFPAGLVALLDLIPFSAENARVVAAPLLIPHESGLRAGAFAALEVDF